ncbi:MAG: dihydroorotase [Rhodobacteraceae bacterium]|nr:dihydroorotase [Paracoccaceae bacterium]
MNELVIKNARLIDPATGRDELGWLAIASGVITDLGMGKTPEATSQYDAGGLVLAPGLIDMRAHAGAGLQPGKIAEISAAALRWGITTTCLYADVTDAAALAHLRNGHHGSGRIEFFPPLTHGDDDARMVDVGLLKEAGAIGFANGGPMGRNNVHLRRALTYARDFEALVALQPVDPELSDGDMHEGLMATRLGLKGIPILAETIELRRLLAQAEDSHVRAHMDLISSAEGLAIMEAFPNITASASIHNLLMNDLDVGAYRTFTKIIPPLREESDRLALIDAVKKDQIKAVVSANMALGEQDKRVPYGEAAAGAAGFDILLAGLLQLVHEERLTLLEALRPVTSGPANILGLPTGRLAIGAPADLILVDIHAPWQVARHGQTGFGDNQPMEGRLLQGLVRQAWVAGKAHA